MRSRAVVGKTPLPDNSRFNLLSTLLHRSEAHSLSFQSSPHSLRLPAGCVEGVYPGWHHEQTIPSSAIWQSPLNPVESALTDDLRVSAEINRNCPGTNPLESALTEFAPISLADSTHA